MKREEFTNFSLSDVPSSEDDRFEFKSSRITFEGLKKEIGFAVSAFANSGGGVIVVGVSDKGESDGGILIKVGRTKLRDWADQVIHLVEPTPEYDVRLIPVPNDKHADDERAVLLVWVGESYAGPHMAPDGRYYIRAGAHTEPARHFIVEAILAKRHFSKPRLAHLVRSRPDDGEVVQIGFFALTDAPAIDVELAMHPLPGLYGEGCREFPVHIGIIEKNTPFFFDVSTREDDRRNPDDEFLLKVTYHDLLANSYTYEQRVNLFRSVPSLRFFKKGVDDIVRSLDSIQQELAGRSEQRMGLLPP